MIPTLIKDIVEDQQGAAAIEYGLILALIFIAMVASLSSVADSTIDMWADVEAKSSEAMSN
ncbi:MAG: Flp family type IVb pilin [Alphaproteobacteria bacterium HGW-Alphaproteobacteria-7]|jgi:pilus assembly protein Flp/PilA|nr:MAG: Flp family type IVb pilin [Alphaproteobacteria bacterium HGW-Alphaproteobacteria-7]PKP67291.1 MAG: Flp family type IVb pilin [Alphaproteobacteria bacterium HGW-Alphaproteobacteria-9]